MAIQSLGVPRRRMAASAQVAKPSTAGVRRVSAAKSGMFQSVANLAATLEERRYKAEFDDQYSSAKRTLVKGEAQLARDLAFKYEGTAYKDYDKEYKQGMSDLHSSILKDVDNTAALDKFNNAYDTYSTKAEVKRGNDTQIKRVKYYRDQTVTKRDDDLKEIATSGDASIAAELHHNYISELSNDDMNIFSIKENTQMKEKSGEYAYILLRKIIAEGKNVETAKNLLEGKSVDPKIKAMIGALGSDDRIKLTSALKVSEKRQATFNSKYLKDTVADTVIILENGGDMSPEQISSLQKSIKADPIMDSMDKNRQLVKLDIAQDRQALEHSIATHAPKDWDSSVPLRKDATIKERATHARKQAVRRESFNAASIAIYKDPSGFLSKHDTNFNNLARNADKSSTSYKDYKDAFIIWSEGIGEPNLSSMTPEIKAKFKNIESLVSQGNPRAAADEMNTLVDTLGGDAYALARKSGVSKDMLATADAGVNQAEVMRLLSSEDPVPRTKGAKMEWYKEIKSNDYYEALVGNGTMAEIERATAWSNVVYKRISQMEAKGSKPYWDSSAVSEAFKLLGDDNAIITSGNRPMIIPKKYKPEKVSSFIKYAGIGMDSSTYKELDIKREEDLTENDHIDALRAGSRWRRTPDDYLVLHAWDDELNDFGDVLNSKGLPVKVLLEDIAKDPLRIKEIPMVVDDTDIQAIDLLKGTM